MIDTSEYKKLAEFYGQEGPNACVWTSCLVSGAVCDIDRLNIELAEVERERDGMIEEVAAYVDSQTGGPFTPAVIATSIRAWSIYRRNSNPGEQVG